MKGDDHIITYLNRLLSDELIAANQYFLHSTVFKSLGLKRLHRIEYQECMDELDHADLYAKRILFLKEIPFLRNFDALSVSKNVEDVFKADLALEYRSVDNLRDSIQYAESIQDYISKEIMIKILQNEEEHIDFLETELTIMATIGMHNYIQSQLKN